MLQFFFVFTNRPEILLKLVGSPSSSTQRSVQAGEVLVTPHLDEAVHIVCGKPDEVQVALAATHDQILQLQVYIADARVAVGHIGGQVAADALQALHFLLLLFRCDVLRFKVDQLHQSASNIHAKPREG